jgi:hypothetical protein
MNYLWPQEVKVAEEERLKMDQYLREKKEQIKDCHELLSATQSSIIMQ